MQSRLRDLGFASIEVIDEDLGRSAAGTQMRSGFEHMVAEVCLGRVGAVAAREVSRAAVNEPLWTSEDDQTLISRAFSRILTSQRMLLDVGRMGIWWACSHHISTVSI